MPKYLIEASYTHEGVEGVRSKGGSSRRDAVAHTAESLGGQLDAFYFAFGDHDAVVIVDLPDNEAAAAVALSVDAAGGRPPRQPFCLPPNRSMTLLSARWSSGLPPTGNLIQHERRSRRLAGRLRACGCEAGPATLLAPRVGWKEERRQEALLLTA